MVDVKFHEVVVDCADPPTLAAWWAGFTGYTLRTTDPEWSVIVAPERALIIGFQKVPEGKVVKNRVHLDFAAPDEEAAAKEIEAMGATRRWVSEKPDDPFVVLADPEGNEFCIVRSA
jgi:predicted enzyme related to lactoylglutathione lyase